MITGVPTTWEHPFLCVLNGVSRQQIPSHLNCQQRGDQHQRQHIGYGLSPYKAVHAEEGAHKKDCGDVDDALPSEGDDQ